MDLKSDVYYREEYADLYINKGIDEIFSFRFESGDKFVSFMSIKRPILSVSGVEIQGLYDLETPYGYGGPFTNTNDRFFLEQAFREYKEHCKKENIVCEFIRFHPFNSLSRYDFLFDMLVKERDIAIVDLMVPSEMRRSLYSKKTRNIIKRASEKLELIRGDIPLSSFVELYYETMNENNAGKFYYFDEDYFNSLIDIDGVDMFAVKKNGEYASVGFFMMGKEIAHYHLSANNKLLSKENGNYLLLESAFEHAKENGARYMMLGGGRTSSTDDSLLKFKQKFASITKPFYIAGLDFMPEKKELLNKTWMEMNPGVKPPNLFQMYRV